MKKLYLLFLLVVSANWIPIAAQQSSCFDVNEPLLTGLFTDDCLDAVHYGTYNGQVVAWAQPLCPDYPGTVMTCSEVYCTTGGFTGGNCPSDFFTAVIDYGVAASPDVVINACQNQNPATTLPWLANMLTWSCDDVCSGPVYQTQYNGETVFFNLPEDNLCADAMISVMDCAGNQICFFGGFAGGTGAGCPAFFETIGSATPLCSGSAGNCNPGTVAVTLPQNTVCLGGGVLPPVFDVTVLPATPPSGYSLRVFVTDTDGNIVVPFSANTTVDFTPLGDGTFYTRAIIYSNADAPDLTATSLAQLNLSGGCYVISPVTPQSQLLITFEVPHVAITSPPNCNGDGTYTVGLTVTGSTGQAYFSTMGGVILPEGVETFLTLSNEYIELHVTDVLTGCGEDFIELYGPVNCQDCINPDQIDTGIFCIEIYDPVCGCNNVTYDNWCFAYYYGGVTSWTQGACNTGNDYYFEFDICPGESISIGQDILQGNMFYDWTPTNDITGCATMCGTNCVNCYNITVAPTVTTTYTLHTFLTLNMEHNYYHYTINVVPCGNDYYYEYNICAGDSIDIGMEGWQGNVLYDWTPTTNITGCADACGGGCENCYNITVAPTTATTYTLHTFYTLGMEHNYYHYSINVWPCGSNGSVCVDTSLIDLTVGCPDVYMPVCGCNFVTYGNTCEALNYGGVTTWTLGECGTADTLLLCKNDSVQIGVPWIFETLYEWLPAEGLSCSDIGCNYSWASPDTTTLYVLREYSPIGGYGLVHHYLVMVENCDTTGIVTPTGGNLLNITLYPNPATTEVWLQYNSLQVYELSVTNIWGQILVTQKQLPPQGYRLPLNQLPNGVLLLQLKTNNGTVVKKLFKDG
ncbi:T9SS C-terminal target domain-containing protein [Sphingobacteriales bacterium UPWRP_1]|nr:hypothetical protein B6N25_14515 [Sphingobacteriales bacterium TSM_CSS]PSJ78916.1 T9SS C-terminal target domain-containing protein [Sphingobacteriales bacterium UPWRP_1]